jgi:hypothetical protein
MTFEQLIEELEEQISEMRAHEANQQQRELRKIRMTYEILARNELNQKLAEINSFLEDRAAAQAESDRRKELVSMLQNFFPSSLTTKPNKLSKC